MQMNTYQATSAHANAEPRAPKHGSDAAAQKVVALSAYATLLTAPMSLLASNAADRADVSFAAILGYN
jgi:hypothetical protein